MVPISSKACIIFFAAMYLLSERLPKFEPLDGCFVSKLAAFGFFLAALGLRVLGAVLGGCCRSV